MAANSPAAFVFISAVAGDLGALGGRFALGGLMSRVCRGLGKTAKWARGAGGPRPINHKGGFAVTINFILFAAITHSVISKGFIGDRKVIRKCIT